MRILKSLLLFLVLVTQAHAQCRSELKFGTHMDMGYENPTSYAADVAAAASVNSHVSRNTLIWSEIESTQGVRNWTRTDAYINALVGAGIEPLEVIAGSPQWANGSSNQFTIPSGTGTTFTTWVNNYANFVSAAVNRYKDRVHRWEMWNEENDIGFWSPAANVAQYVIWYNTVRAAILAADPTAMIALGGMSGGCCTGPNGQGGFTFLQNLYNAGVFPDIVAIHPYNTDGTSGPTVTIPFQGNFTDITTYRSIMVNNGQGAKPIWVTEWGWSTNSVSQATQAAYIGQSLAMIKNWYPYVTLATLFWLRDVGGGFGDGLLNNDYSQKLSAPVYASFVGP